MMRNLTTFTAIVALGNLAISIWHLRLAGELNPALTFAEAVRIGTFAAVLTLIGIILLWAQRTVIGSLVLVVVFMIGLVIGSVEHFFVPGPNNVFDAGVGTVAFLFRFTVGLLLILEIGGLWCAGRIIKSSRHSLA